VSAIPFISDADVAAALPVVVRHLEGGGLLAYPTETVYGLGSRARTAEVQALNSLKGRRPDKPFLLLISDRGMAERQGLAFSAAAEALSRAF
jgi:L-threonylcarbamoyladenylate synthase